jgi:NADPH2:quinone reductase
MKTHAIRIHETGGPEVLRWEEIAVGAPGEGEVLVRNEAVGLNFIDVYHRTGLYPLPLPLTGGNEGAGVVEAIGPGVAGFAVGDRVAYVAQGSYAERLLRPAAKLVKLPDAIDARTAAGMMLKGMTAEYLLRRTHEVQAGETILVHAAAGGVGQILCQWGKALGAIVIGTVGHADKAAIATGAGADHVILSGEEDVAARVREITGGKGVPVVYDGVGAATFEASLKSLAKRGLLVSYGNASGPVPPFSPGLLSSNGSLYLTRPTLNDYTGTSEELRASAAALFDVVIGGQVKIAVEQTYALKDAGQAHRDLEARKLTGSTVLLP